MVKPCRLIAVARMTVSERKATGNRSCFRCVRRFIRCDLSLPGRSVRYSHGLPAAGAGLAAIGYSVASRSSAGSVDVIGATALGLALFCPSDLGEFVNCFQV